MKHQSHGRSPRAALALGAVYLLVAVALIVFDAAFWLMALVIAFTLPAVWDFARNPSAGLELTDDALTWYSGRRQARLGLDEIDHMRFDTRWDFSVRVSAVLKGTKKRIRLPHETLPPHRDLEQAFQARGIRVERHHFTIF